MGLLGESLREALDVWQEEFKGVGDRMPFPPDHGELSREWLIHNGKEGDFGGLVVRQTTGRNDAEPDAELDEAHCCGDLS